MEIYIDECSWASMSARDHRWVYTSIRSQICEFLTERLSRGHHITTTSFKPSYNLNINDLASCIVIYTNTLRLWSRDIRERERERELLAISIARSWLHRTIEHNLNVNFFEREREGERASGASHHLSRTLVTSQDPTEHPNVNFFEGERERENKHCTHFAISFARSWRHKTLPSIGM